MNTSIKGKSKINNTQSKSTIILPHYFPSI